MRLTDDQIRTLLGWYVNESQFYKKFSIERQEGMLAAQHWINSEYIRNASDADLKNSFLEYYRNGTGKKQNINQLHRDRIARDISKLRKSVLFLLDEDIPIENRLNGIFDGDYKMIGLGRAVVTAMLMDSNPGKYCLWNQKTEKGFDVLGWGAYERGDSTAAKYLKALDRLNRLKGLRTGLNMSFLDVDGFLHTISSEPEGIQKVIEITGGGNEPQYWQIAPGEGAKLWEEMRRDSIAAVGWDAIQTDLKSFSNEELSAIHIQAYPKSTEKQTSTKLMMLSNFLSIKPGDKIVTNKGRKVILAIGTVKSGYRYRPERQAYRHTVDVEYYQTSDQGVPIPDNLKGKFGKTITPLKKLEFEILESLFGPVESKTWIFQANPKVYDLEGALKALPRHLWTIKQHKDRVHAGDRVYLWQSGKDAGILARGTILSDPASMPEDEDARPFYMDPKEFDQISYRAPVGNIKILDKLLTRDTLRIHPVLSGLTILKSAQGSIFPVKIEQAQAIEKMIGAIAVGPYTKEDAMKDLFIDEQEFDFIISRLKTKKNIILQGPPGVGKTYIAKRLAYYFLGVKDDSRISLIQFHQSFSYEDFIQGFRPSEDGTFYLKNGIFYELCEKARQDSTREYFLIIDEINRGNLSKIFGETLMLVEADKRSPDYSVALTYSKRMDDTFFIPENVFLIGTMNTADRSLAMVDYALRRRFGFITLEPKFHSNKFKGYLKANGVPEKLVDKLTTEMLSLNSQICDDTKNLGRGYCIGHSCFCPTNTDILYDEDWYTAVVRAEIEPLLQEYWFDDPQKVKNLVDTLLTQ